MSDAVLVVDLDGSLLRSDALLECVARVAASKPWLLLAVPFWLLRGRAYLKARLAQAAELQCGLLPFRGDVLALVAQAREEGRTTVLATASDNRVAEAVSATLRVFDAVIASDGSANVKSARKLAAIEQYCNGRAFDYVGDASADRPIWQAARRAYVVSAPQELRRLQRQQVTALALDECRPSLVVLLARELRVWQWSKNLLVAVPALFAGELTSPPSWFPLLVAFTAFCLVASGIYLLNDLLDLEDDRAHGSKRARPLASGHLDLRWGILGAPAFVLAGFLLAYFAMPTMFLVWLAGYAALNLLYNFHLKQVAVLDVLALSLLYTLRLIAGGAALGIVVSHWLLAFSLFVFLSLSMAKRGTELLRREDGVSSRRGYVSADLQSITTLGGASGYVSLVVLALYIQDPDVAQRYAQPELLWWLFPVLLFWISRMWLLVNRGHMHDDPVEFVVKDPASWGCVGAGIALWALAGV